jgi:hypothetical protein
MGKSIPFSGFLPRIKSPLTTISPRTSRKDLCRSRAPRLDDQRLRLWKGRKRRNIHLYIFPRAFRLTGPRGREGSGTARPGRLAAARMAQTDGLGRAVMAAPADGTPCHIHDQWGRDHKRHRRVRSAGSGPADKDRSPHLRIPRVVGRNLNPDLLRQQEHLKGFGWPAMG